MQLADLPSFIMMLRCGILKARNFSFYYILLLLLLLPLLTLYLLENKRIYYCHCDYYRYYP